MTAEAATEGITVATIRAAAEATGAADGVAVKAEDLATTAIPDKADGARMEMAAEIVAIALRLIMPLTLQSARASLIKAKTVATATVTRIKTRIVIATGIVTKTKTKTKTGIVTRTEIKARSGTVTKTRIGTVTKTEIRIATGTVIKIRTKTRTKTGIAGAEETMAGIAGTVAILSTTTQLFTNLGTTTTMLMV
jgi:hypothetical protein